MFRTNLFKQFKDYFRFEGFFIYPNAATTHNSPFSLPSQPRSHLSFLFQPQLSFLVQFHLCLEIGKQKDLPKYSSSSQTANLLSSTFRG